MTYNLPLAVLTGFCLLAAGCVSSPPPPPPAGKKSAQAGKDGADVQKLSDEELSELVELSHAIVVARVEERTDNQGAIDYRLLVERVVLSGRGDTSTHPAAEGGELHASDFWFRRGGAKSIGGLGELQRYLFFLAQGEAPNRWFHLADASAFPMPAARPTRERAEALVAELEKVRARAPKPAQAPEDARDPEARDEPK